MNDPTELVAQAFGPDNPAGYEDGLIHACPYCGVMHSNYGCLNGKVHGAVLTAEDDLGVYDERVLGPVPNGHQYGYCEDCRAAFRWDVGEHRWMPWTQAERQKWRAEYRRQQEARQQRIEEALA